MRVLTAVLAAVLALPACAGRDPASNIPGLVEDLKGADADRKGQASLELVRLGEPAVPAVAELLKSPEAGHRATAASVLFGMGARAAAAAPALGEAMSDPDQDVRLGAAMALESIGPAAAVAVPQLIAALKDPEFPVRQRAAKALGRIGPAAQDAVPALTVAAKGDPAAEEAIRKIRSGR